jgi:hypothetical protein
MAVKSTIAVAVLGAFCVGAHAQNNSTQSAQDQSHSMPSQQDNAAQLSGSQNNADDNTAQSSGANQGQQVVRPLQVMREVIALRGTVINIDRQNRVVTLQGAGGDTLVARVGDNVQNFDKLKVGEPAVVRYTEAAVLEITKNGKSGQAQNTQQQSSQSAQSSSQSTQSPQQSAQSSQQPSGQDQLPTHTQISVVGRVTNVDPSNNKVTVQDQDGQQIEMKAPNKEALSGITKGDKVFVTYTEATAISVQTGQTTGQQQSDQSSGQAQSDQSGQSTGRLQQSNQPNQSAMSDTNQPRSNPNARRAE